MYRARGYGGTRRRSYRKRIGYGGTSRRPFKSQRGFLRTGGNYRRYRGLGYNPRGRAERKFFDIAFSTVALVAPASAVFQHLLDVDQGTGASDRLGQRITVVSIQLEMFINMNSATTGQALHIRGALVEDRQANGAVPGFNNYYASVTSTAVRTLSNIQRFRTLKEWDFNINSPGFAGNGTANDSSEVLRKFNLFKKCNIKVRYSGSTGVITAVQSTNIVFIIMASSTTPVSTLTGTMRFRYIDA